MPEEHKRSIQDIIPPARSKPIRPSLRHEDTESLHPKLPLKPKREKRDSSMLGLIGIALGVIVVVGIAFGVVSTMFHRADVTITPYAFSATVAETFEASPQGEVLSFATLSYEETISKTVASSRSEYVENTASGTVTVYNEYSTQSQRLIANTRFESENGLIYRIKAPVTVPGYTTSSGKKQPGTAEVTVYADEPGEKYNIAAGAFTIPGLKGSPQFESMYARSTSAQTGGYVGERAVVEESVRNAAVADLKSELDRKVRAGLALQINQDQFIGQNTVTVDFVEQPDRAVSGGAEVTVKAIARAPVFSQSQIAKLIASENGIVFDAPLYIQNVDTLSLQVGDSGTEGNKTLTISGQAELVAVVNQEQFVRDILGKDQESVGAVLTGYPGIKDLSLSVYPFWRRALPTEPGRFNVRVDE